MADTSVKPPTARDKTMQWDTKEDCLAPLTDAQLDSVVELSNIAHARPLPDGLLPDDRHPSSSGSTIPPAAAHIVQPQSSSSAKTHLPAEKVFNGQEFISWFNEITEEIEQEDDISYVQYMAQLREYRDKCCAVLTEVTRALEYLKELKQKHVVVSTKTNALHEACEQLLEEQTKLTNTAEAIQQKLSYFNELDRISIKLESAAALTVTSEAFVPMLLRLDECIAFISANPQYKDAEVFLSRFRQCQGRALGLIKAHVVNILQQATSQVLPKKDSPSDNEDAFTLFYGKFRTNAPKVKLFVEQIERRTSVDSRYEQILSDCHQCYFSQRLALVGPTVIAALNELASKHTRDHCALMRSGCALMLHVCEDEHQLFHSFFTKPSPALNTMLEGMCSYLYDIFRPLIIHVNHLETLSELCTILKVEMLDESVPLGNVGLSGSDERLQAFEAVCQQMLADVQERLVYRTYVYIGTDILRYNPAPGDVAYPQKLEMMESIAQNIKKTAAVPSPMPPVTALGNKGHERSESVASLESLEVASINSAAIAAAENGEAFRDPSQQMAVSSATHLGGVSSPVGGVFSSMPSSPADLHGMWYPTVRRTLVCLSKLARCTNRVTFQGLSQEALSCCIKSLLTAKAAIEQRATVLDGLLFFIKHLLILREQIAPFQIEFSIKESSWDFSKMKGAAYGLIQRRGDVFKLNSTNALLRLFVEGTPQMTEHIVDSKREVDSQLKSSCEAFIDHIVQLLGGQLKSYLHKFEAVEKMGSSRDSNTDRASSPPRAGQVQLRSQPFSKPDAVRDALADAFRTLKARTPAVQRSMSLYLANRDTEQILLKPIKQTVLSDTQKLLTILERHYTEEERQIISCPSVEQVSLIMAPKYH